VVVVVGPGLELGGVGPRVER
jgi:hypothetical protein